MALPTAYLRQIRFDVARALGVVNNIVHVQLSPIQALEAPAFTVGTSRIVVNPSYFSLQPWHQFAVMIHEYMHALGASGELLADQLSLEVASRLYGDPSTASQWFRLRVGRRLGLL